MSNRNPPNNAMDFNKLRKKRRRAQTFKRMAILAAILLAIAGILSINRVLVNEGFTRVMRDFFGGLGGQGYPIAAPGGVLREVRSLEGDVAVLNDTNLYLYNNKGKELLNLQKMNENTVFLSAGSRILTYDVGGSRYQIHTRTNLLLEGEHDASITAMALGERGDYALVSSSKQYAAQVTAWDHRNEQVFQWLSNELVSAIAIHPQGGKMAAGALGASGGVLQSTVFLFSFQSDKEIARVEFSDQLLLQLSYLEGGNLGALTDRGYYVLDESGKQLGAHSFGGEQLRQTQFAGGDALILTEHSEARQQTLLLVDKGGKEVGRYHPDRPVRDMQTGSQVYLLTDEGISRLNRSLALQGTYDSEGSQRILQAGGKLYGFTPEEIKALELQGE